MRMCVLSCLFAHYGLQPARLLYLWDSPGKNTRVGFHAILQGIFLTRNQTCISYVSCIARQVLYHYHHFEKGFNLKYSIVFC